MNASRVLSQYGLQQTWSCFGAPPVLPKAEARASFRLRTAQGSRPRATSRLLRGPTPVRPRPVKPTSRLARREALREAKMDTSV